MSRAILFLDFDGVLHPVGSRGRAFMCRPLLESLLREPAVLHVDVVISSSWRMMYPLEGLRQLFSADIRSRIVDRTPLPGLAEMDFARYREIRAWLDAHPAVARWIAVDDDAEGFPPDAHRHLVLADPAMGLDERSIGALRAALAA